MCVYVYVCMYYRMCVDTVCVYSMYSVCICMCVCTYVYVLPLGRLHKEWIFCMEYEGKA